MALEINQIFDVSEATKIIVVDKALVQVDNTLIKLATDIKTLTEFLSQNNISFAQLAEAQKKVEGTSKILTEAEKQLIATEKAIAEALKLKIAEEKKATAEALKASEAARKLTVEHQKEIITKANLTRETKLLAAAQTAEKGSTAQLSAVVGILEGKLRNVNQTTVEGKKKADLLRSAIDKTNAKIKEQSSALSAQRINIGNYRNSLEGMTVRIKELQSAQKNVNLSTREGQQEFRKIQQQINQTKASVDKYTNSNKRATGASHGFAGGIKRMGMQFLGALGLTSVVFMFVNVLKGAFSTIREFSKQNAVLAGVLGKTRKEVKQLTEQAIQLGAIYPITASEVNKLQVSFARLGFTQSEIINLTEATIRGSIALNSELDATATLVGAVVLAYQNLGTENAGEIIDKLTLSTQRSSLSFMSLETAIPKVAGAANALNISLSTTLAHLGTAHDATLDASVAGTSMRNIYLELSKRGLTMNEALELINTSSSKLNTSFELFGKRGAIVGLALANNIDKTNELEVALNKAGGTAERVAKEQMATLDGAVSGLKSSWEKLILSFKGSEGVLSTLANDLSLHLDIMSSRYLSFWGKITAYVPWAGKKLIKLNADFNEAILAIQNAKNEEELSNLEAHYGKLRTKSSKFDMDVFNAVRIRYESLAKGQLDADTRENLATQNAALEKLAIKREAAEKTTKNAKIESDKRIEIAKKESDRIREISEKSEEDAEDRLLNSIARAEKAYAIRLALEQKMYQTRREWLREQTKDDADKATDDNDLLLKKFADQTKENDDKKDKDDADKKEIKAAIQDAAFETASRLSDELTNRRIANLQKEFDVLMLQKEGELSNANLTAEQKQAIEEKYAKKAAEIKTKQAKAEKQGAIIQSLINTAVSVTKLLWNPILAAIAGSMGAIQTAFIAARKIPEFFRGTKNTPDRFIAGDKKGGGSARELMQLDSGKLMLIEKPTYFEGNDFKGATVWSNPETERIISQSERLGFKGSSMTDARIVSELQQTRKAIQNMPQVIISDTGNMIAKRTRLKKEKYYYNKFGIN